MVSSILKVGTQLDIKVSHQAEKAGQKPRILRSVIYDVRNNGELEIGMPVEGGRIVLLPLGARYELVFSTKGGLYRSVGQVKERYKSGNLYMVVMELKESLSKSQRREYYRMSCLLDIEYLPLTPEESRMESEEEILKYHSEKFPLEYMYPAVAVDVSGGGMRFVAERELEVPSDILLKMPIKNGDIENEIYLKGVVLSGKFIEDSTRRREYRLKFTLEDGHLREEIIRFIFEEERKGRNKKKG